MFELPPLPFAENALEPLMSRDTLATHHGKHHAAYIKKTNDMMQKQGWTEAALEAVVRRAAQEKQQGLFNNAAQAWNHAFFWQCLAPPTQGAPQGDLAAALERKFGSLDDFRAKALDEGEGHFGSGWLWLVYGADAELALISLHDAQTPIVDAGVTPIFTIDLWEHAYYLDHKNARRAYLEAVYGSLLNWSFAARQYEAAKSGSGGWRFADAGANAPERRSASAG